MLLTITTTHRPATDVGYLLHKNPARPQTFELAFGKVHVFYPEAREDRCTAALLLDVDAVGAVRGKGQFLSDYVNDRPYASTSLLSVAMARTLREAMSGRSKERPELAKTPLALEATVAAAPCGGNDELVERLFEPLGYEVETSCGDLDPDSCRHRDVRLTATTTLARLLTQIYVLLPVLDNHKHYYVGEAETKKLLERGEGWLEDHPERNLIVKRYLGHRKSLTDDADARLGTAVTEAETDETVEEETVDVETTPSLADLHERRHEWVIEKLRALGARRVVDLGCGEGRLLEKLVADTGFTEVVGAESSPYALMRARRRIRPDRLPAARRGQVRLIQSSLVCRDERLKGYDAAVLVEVVEHVEPAQLPMFEDALFGQAQPGAVVLTTPNREYNRTFDRLRANGLRHPDHRFEWTRTEFETWAAAVAGRYGYTVTLDGVGPVHGEYGPPTLAAVLTRTHGQASGRQRDPERGQ